MSINIIFMEIIHKENFSELKNFVFLVFSRKSRNNLVFINILVEVTFRKP